LSNRNIFRWVIIIASFAIISLILWNTYTFFQHFKAEERTKMNAWTFSYSEFSKDLYNPNVEINKVAEYFVLDSTLTTPMLLLDNGKNIMSFRNIDSLKVLDSLNLSKLIVQLRKENDPIEIDFGNSESGTLYYGNSPLLNKLKYYPLALILIIVLFAAVAFFFYKSSRVATQNKLWTGMAKETAHQIGTPLSSLIGWTEILKMEDVNPDHISEIEKDINRLQTITDRFSKMVFSYYLDC